MTATLTPLLRALGRMRAMQVLEQATRHRDEMAHAAAEAADRGDAATFTRASAAFRCSERAVAAVEQELVHHLTPTDFAQA